MRSVLIAAAAVVALASASGRAGAHPPPFAGPTLQTATIDRHTGTVVPATTRLQPVIGTVKPVPGHFHLFGHKSQYSALMFNPLHGTFATHVFKFKR
jgi:hypothetical protein